MTFEEVVAEWMRANGYKDVAAVIACDGEGSDWAGDTEGGFYETFRVAVKWETTEGKVTFDDIDGVRMQSLWMHVAGAWGDHAS